ncbi:MAG: hypothetical protein QW580_01915 [Nitrososphaerota archaeon]
MAESMSDRRNLPKYLNGRYCSTCQRWWYASEENSHNIYCPACNRKLRSELSTSRSIIAKRAIVRIDPTRYGIYEY